MPHSLAPWEGLPDQLEGACCTAGEDHLVLSWVCIEKLQHQVTHLQKTLHNMQPQPTKSYFFALSFLTAFSFLKALFKNVCRSAYVLTHVCVNSRKLYKLLSTARTLMGPKDTSNKKQQLLAHSCTTRPLELLLASPPPLCLQSCCCWGWRCEGCQTYGCATRQTPAHDRHGNKETLILS
jgi:hypothetical protein